MVSIFVGFVDQRDEGQTCCEREATHDIRRDTSDGRSNVAGKVRVTMSSIKERGRCRRWVDRACKSSDDDGTVVIGWGLDTREWEGQAELERGGARRSADIIGRA